MANNQNLKPFVKGDPRCHRGGRPKSFNALRALVKMIGNETIASRDGVTIMSRVELELRSWLTGDNPMLKKSFMEIGWGKVPDMLEVEVKHPIKVIHINMQGDENKE